MIYLQNRASDKKITIPIPDRTSGQEDQDFLPRPVGLVRKIKIYLPTGRENADFLTTPIGVVRKIKISLPDRASGKEYQDLLTELGIW